MVDELSVFQEALSNTPFASWSGVEMIGLVTSATVAGGTSGVTLGACAAMINAGVTLGGFVGFTMAGAVGVVAGLVVVVTVCVGRAACSKIVTNCLRSVPNCALGGRNGADGCGFQSAWRLSQWMIGPAFQSYAGEIRWCRRCAVCLLTG
jgi:hypothetical protein